MLRNPKGGAAEAVGLQDIAEAVRKAYVDDIKGCTCEEAFRLQEDVDLCKFTDKYNFKIKGIVIPEEDLPEALSSGDSVNVMEYSWKP